MPSRFQVCYVPRLKVVAAGHDKGWSENSDVGLLDVVTNYETFEEVDSTHLALDAALQRARQLVRDGRDLFGQVTVEEQECLLIVPEDDFRQWETVADHHVDETDHVETIRREVYA